MSRRLQEVIEIVCNHKCCKCIYDDCICDEMTLEEYQETREIDKEIMKFIYALGEIPDKRKGQAMKEKKENQRLLMRARLLTEKIKKLEGVIK